MTEFSPNIKFSDFRTQIMTVREIVDMWEKYSVENSTYLIRKPSNDQCSRYVEAILIGLPLQPFYVDSNDGKWLFIGGSERAYAFAKFVEGKIPLTSLYFKMRQYEGLYFDGLSFLARQNILNTEVTVNVLNPGLLTQERFGIYLCLKNRLDSDTLKACRQKIYGEKYHEIERLAKEIVEGARKKTAVLENEICHLMVLSVYDKFLDKDIKFHIDLVANVFLEEEVFLSSSEEREKIRTALKYSQQKPRKDSREQDYYNATVYFLGEGGFNEELFTKAYQEIIGTAVFKNSFSGICGILDKIIKKLKSEQC